MEDGCLLVAMIAGATDRSTAVVVDALAEGNRSLAGAVDATVVGAAEM